MQKGTFLILVLFSLFTNLIFAQKKPAYKIDLKVNGLKDSTCYLAHFYLKNSSQIIKDTAVCDKNGNIGFEGNTVLPEGIYIISIGNSNSVQIIIGDQFLEAETEMTDLFGKMKITVGSENKIFYEYQAKMASLNASYRKLKEESKAEDLNFKQKLGNFQKEAKDFQTSFYNKYKNSTAAYFLRAPIEPEIPKAPLKENGGIDSTFALKWIQNHYFDYLDLSDERMIKTPFLSEKLDYYLDNLHYQIPDSLIKAADFLMLKTKDNKSMKKYVASSIAGRYEVPKFMGGDKVFVHMAEKYFIGMPMLWDSSTLAPIAEKTKSIKNVLIGQKVQNAQLTDTTGKTLIPLHGVKAKYTLLFIYDPECGHCRDRVPKILAFYDKMKSKDLKVYAYATTNEVPKIVKFVKEFKTNSFINAYDHLLITDYKTKYNAYTTPQVILLDENKMIIGKGLEEEQMEDLIGKFEKENKSNSKK